MKLWVPITSNQFKYTNEYINYCNVKLQELKILLKTRLDNNKLSTRKNSLLESNSIIWLPNTINFNLNSITDTYIKRLYCSLDRANNHCYYTIPIGIRCPGTKTSLDTVIRLIEFGNDIIPPMNWIRHTYHEFVETMEVNQITKF